MRKAGLFLFCIGASGFLIGGAGIDGPTFTSSMVLAVTSFVVAAVGNKLLEKSDQILKLEEAKRRRKEIEIETTEEAITRAKEATFQVWLKSGRLDV